jgi:predicted phage terminase large subunit-like protein
MMNVHDQALIKEQEQPRQKPFTSADLAMIEELYAAEARESLWAFRQYIDPKMRIGWWPKQVSMHFQRFFTKLKNGHRPKMLLMAPPQHGKSKAAQDGIAWMSGKDKELRTIFASYSADLGVKTNGVLQKIFDDEKYRRVFPLTQIAPISGGEQSGRYQRNSKKMEFIDARGFFENVTVDGQVTGKTLDLGFVDDPIKGRAEAASPQIRDKVWMWLMDDFFSRFDDAAGMIMTVTRWHVDDPAGRMLERFPDLQVLRYPVFGTPESIRLNNEPRKAGEVLFPEFKSRAFIMERKTSYSQASWESLYMQNPIIVGGGVFPIEEFRIIASFNIQDVKKSVRYWDKAGTLAGGAYTCGVLMHQMKDGRIIVQDVRRGQWDARKREEMIKQAAQIDNAQGRVETWIEQEPGSGGKESAERTIQNLAGFIVKAERATGDKVTRSEPYQAQVQGGNVHLLRSKTWNRAFIDEHETFPAGRYKDQVDAASGAFNKLISKSYRYDASMKWA